MWKFPVMINDYKHLPAWVRIIISFLIFPAAAKTLQRTMFTAVAIHDFNKRNQWSGLVNNNSYECSEYKLAMKMAPKRSPEVSEYEWFNEKLHSYLILKVQLVVEEIHLEIKHIRSIKAGLV